jgi:chromatin remodeling complex protein RSC6
MSPKKSTKTETAPVATTPAPASTEAPVKAKRSSSKKADAPAATTPAPVATESPVKAPSKRAAKRVKQPAEEPSEPEVETEVEESSEPKEKRVVDRTTFDADCTKFSELILSEIEKLRNSETKQLKNKGIKVLRAIHKIFKQIHKDGNKLTKFKKVGTRKTNASSGFLKPVRISPEMAKFLNWDVTKSYSRTQVTKEICDYIAKNKLNDQENKRNINCDAKLKVLLKYDATTAPKDEKGQALPLTYFRLQQYLKNHFIKEETNAELEE